MAKLHRRHELRHEYEVEDTAAETETRKIWGWESIASRDTGAVLAILRFM